ncbi:interleukin-37 [Dipodomys merriami]|uniref:interleukin-37 n=1 Tax=Dipodomys merriami TaxID=94247 RepID=UPI003855C4F5
MSALEESEVKMDSQDWKEDDSQCSSEGSKLKAKEPEKYSIHDGDHKVFVLDEGTLKAIPMKSYILPEIFFVLASRLESATVEKGNPIFLAVSKGEFCLYCNKDKGKRKPSLQLKKKQLKSLAGQKELAQKPFIFYQAKAGSLYTLESAANPGWFVCTSCNSGEPVGVTNKVGKKEHTEFLFKKICKPEMSE